MPDSVYLISATGTAGHQLWLRAVVALILLVVVCLLLKFGLRRFRYKDGDLKAAGLNHRERREWRAIERRKRKERKKPRRKSDFHY